MSDEDEIADQEFDDWFNDAALVEDGVLEN